MVEKKTINWLFIGWMVVVCVGIFIGLWGAASSLFRGTSTWRISDNVPWGILTSTYVFFVAASAGCMAVSLSHALGFKGFEFVIKRAVFLAIITLLAGGIIIILDLGDPLNIFYLLRSPNFGAPLGWMVPFYILYLVLLVIDFYLLHKHGLNKGTQIVGILAPLAAVAVHSTLGAIFGFTYARPYFGGAFAPIYFIPIALVIGTALLLWVIVLQFKISKKEMSPELHHLTRALGKFLGVVLGIAIFFVIWKNLAGLYSPVETTARAYRYMLFGSPGWWTWGVTILIGLIIPLFLMLNPGTRNLNGILAASTLVLIGTFAARYEFAIGGQVVPLFQGLWQQRFVKYSPTFVEISIVILGFALCALLYTLGNRIFKLEEVPKVPGV